MKLLTALILVSLLLPVGCCDRGTGESADVASLSESEASEHLKHETQPTPAPETIGDNRPDHTLLDHTNQAAKDAAEAIRRQAWAAWTGVRNAVPTTPTGEFGVRVFISPDADHKNGSWRVPGVGERLTEHLVVLVHGLDEPGDIWNDMAPAVAQAGYTVARFEYPNDQPIVDSGTIFDKHLRALRSRGVTRIDLVCHSMGGLVTREVLTAPVHGFVNDGGLHPRVEHLILVGTPNAGSPWAKLRAVGELREQAVRWFNGSNNSPDDLLHHRADGRGEAGRDLLPGSDFLTALNDRPNPPGVDITCVVGLAAPVKDKNLDALFASPLLSRVLGDEDAERMRTSIENLRGSVGDGVVTAESARLDGTRIIERHAHHRSLLRGKDPPAIAIVLEVIGGNDQSDDVEPEG